MFELDHKSRHHTADPMRLASRAGRSPICLTVATILAACSIQVSNRAHAGDAATSVADHATVNAELAAADGTAGNGDLQEVVVSARIRAEKVEDVPIPVTAVGGDKLVQLNDVTVTDFAKLVPNLLVNAPNARQTSIAIRGIGKNTANDALEPSVGVIVDGVASAFIAQSWGDFPDLDHIEVERGPQGTLLGKNTTLGVVQIASKAPGFQDAYSAELGAGNENALNGKFTATGGIVDGLLAYRASFYAEKRNGPFHNDAPDQTNETFQERNRFGGKLQFLLTPTDDLTARFIFDQQQSAELIPWGEAPLIGDPTTFPNGISRTLGTLTTYTSRLGRGYFGGYQPYIANWNNVDNNGSRPTRSNSGGASARVDWQVGGYTLTSISAVRNSLFDAKNDSDWTHFDIARGGAIIHQTQVSQELRLSSAVGERFDYTAGLYFLNAHINSCDRTLDGVDAGPFYATSAQYAALGGPVGKLLLEDSLRGLFVYTCTDPRTVSGAGFGQANWHFTDKATLTVGARVTNEDKHNDYWKFNVGNSLLQANLNSGAYGTLTAAQQSNALAVRAAQDSQLGFVTGTPISATSYAWLFNPSYKLTDDILLYASASHGEKSGAVLFNTTALKPQNVAPEKALDFELGVKAVLLDHRLTVNVNLYDTEVKDYQQNITIPDSTQSSGFRTYLGNAPKVRLSGLEFDTSYTLNEFFSLTWAGAFNRAIYADFKDAPCPADIASQVNAAGTVMGPFQCNLTGRQLPYAPKFTTNLGPEFHAPLGHGYEFHANLNGVFRSRADYAAGLSQYGWQGSYTILDGGVGVATESGKWSYDFIGSNLLDKRYAQDITTFTNQAAVTAYPGERRYYGLRVHLQL